MKFGLKGDSPDTVIESAELYLKDGYSIISIYTTKRVRLNYFEKLHNHIANN